MNLQPNWTASSQNRYEYLMRVRAMSIPDVYQTYHYYQESGQKKKAKELVKALCYWHLKIFAKFFFAHYVPADYGRHHYEIFQSLPHASVGRKVNILAPRGSAKSTLKAIIFPIYRVCYTDYDEKLECEGHQRERFIIIVSKSYDMAESRIKSIQSELENNERLRDHFGDLTSKNWGVKSLETHNGVRIRAIGRGGQIRGSLV